MTGFAQAIVRHAQRAPHRVAIHCDGQDLGYGTLWERIAQATCVLQSLGVARGDRVAWLGLNDPAMLVLLFAVARLGALLVPLNYRLAAAELTAILVHSDAMLLVADAAHGPVAHQLASAQGIDCLAASALAQEPVIEAKLLPDATDLPMLLVYTSGTTGRPKGVVHTQGGLLANCAISAHAQELCAADHVLTVLPLFHVGGLCIQTLPALHVGATLTLHRHFDAAAWLHAVQQRKPSLAVMVPATLRAVIALPGFASADLSSLKMVVTGSSVVPVALIEAFHRRGVPVCQVYGATETGPLSIYQQRADAFAQVGAAGHAGQGVAVRLVDACGHDVAPGAVGEIWVRAPNVMSGYWRDAANPDFQDGWFHSGDLAHCDVNGVYRVVGRCKDMIISGGENIYPAEIENLLASCPEIADVAVLGQADATWGEVAVAVVVRRAGGQLDADAVMRLLHGQIARYKMPKRVLFRDALPKTALGKIEKAVLRATLDA